MARRKKDDGLLIAVGLVLGAVLAVAPFVLIYIASRAGPRLSKQLDDYALSNAEAAQLQQCGSRTAMLDAQNRAHLAQGLTRTQSGEFDRRSRAGKLAYEVNAQLVESSAEYSELRERPGRRLADAISFTKLREAARFAIVGFVAWLAYSAMYMLGPDFGWPSAYFAASAVSLGVFAATWLWFTIYYWASLSELRKQLAPQPA